MEWAAGLVLLVVFVGPLAVLIIIACGLAVRDWALKMRRGRTGNTRDGR